jgi:anaerobic selenocysteine-containing dehydrogenase
MYRKLLTLAAAAAVAATALAPAAGAADSAAPKLKVEGAYLYLDHEPASDQDFVRVVFRTADDLPRRADGAIQAGVSIDGFSHSIGSVKKGAPIYTAAAEVKGGSITSLNGPTIRKGATVGRSYTVRFFTRDGQRVTKKMVLRAERKGDDRGKPLAS